MFFFFFFQGTVVKAPIPEYTDKSMKFYIRFTKRRNICWLCLLWNNKKKSDWKRKKTDFGLTSQKNFSVAVMKGTHNHEVTNEEKKTMFRIVTL